MKGRKNKKENNEQKEELKNEIIIDNN